MPALLKPLIDQGFSTEGLTLWWVPAALLTLFTVRGTAGFTADIALARIANDCMLQVRRAMFARVLNAKAELFGRESATALSNTVVYEVQNGATLLVNTLTTVLKDSVALIGLLAYMLWINWKLTLVAAVILPAAGLLMRLASRRLYKLARSSQVAANELAYVVEENVLAHRVVRLHGAQPAQAQRFDSSSLLMRRLALKAAVASSALTPLIHMLAAITLSIVICIALWQSRHGISVGTFASFIAAMLMLIAPIKRLSEATNPITRALAALERAIELIQQTPTEQQGEHTQARASGAIAFEGVSVQYDADTAAALDQVNLQIRPGETLAIVGPSGSGKTTLVNLLPRFVHPSAGRILLDGVELAQWQLDSLRAQFALVSQDVVMFNDSLGANVALGAEFDAQRVLACLQAANLGDLLAQLPQGINSPCGHNATQLSGGQRQRLAIARALYKDAPILILDEATSALDSASESIVQEALQRLMTGRTTVIIAHRLSTIEHADRVVVLDHGHIVESGSHRELLAQAGLYAKLHALQFGQD